eukprot:m.337220 g.337220  ORF g.337220 m.337220 type:complete len:111 (+) comp18078_c0_seq1:183-515(+)
MTTAFEIYRRRFFSDAEYEKFDSFRKLTIRNAFNIFQEEPSRCPFNAETPELIKARIQNFFTESREKENLLQQLQHLGQLEEDLQEQERINARNNVFEGREPQPIFNGEA